jgi:hypothetical protein
METQEQKPAESAPSGAKLTTYEDCLAAISKAKSGDAALKDATLETLHAFFEKRIGAKKLKDDHDGTGRVKEAYESKRTFKAYSPPAAKPDADNLPGGSLFFRPKS